MLAVLICLLAAALATPPNLVVIMVDDLGFGDVPAFRQDPHAPTDAYNRADLPNIQCLLDQGMKFTDFHTASTLCTPSRASLMTGRLPWRSQMTHSIFEVFTSASQLGGFPAAELTLPEALRKFTTPGQHGWPANAKQYTTGMVGKWHLGVNGDDQIIRGTDPTTGEPTYSWPAGYVPNGLDGRFLPQNQGFQYADLIHPVGNFGSCVQDPKTEAEANNDFLRAQRLRNFCFLMNGTPGVSRVSQRIYNNQSFPERMRDKFDIFLNNYVNVGGGQPAPYLWYHAFLQIHTPYFATPPFKGRNRYQVFDMLEEMDYGVGLLMDRIKAQDAAHGTKTVVIFTSDNGAFYEDYFDPDGLKPNLGQSSSLPFKGGKGVMFEGGSRVPTIAWSNDHSLVKPNSVNGHLFSMMDIFPTFMKLAGLHSAPPNTVPSTAPHTVSLVPSTADWNPVDGYDITANLLDEHRDSPWANKFLPYYCGELLQAGRLNDSKLIWVQQLFVDASDFQSGVTAGDDSGEDGGASETVPGETGLPITSTSQCDGGACCPVPPGATGTCSCGDHVAFVGANGQPVVEPQAGRVAPQEKNHPLMFNLPTDPHEDCNLRDGTDPDRVPPEGPPPANPACRHSSSYQPTVDLGVKWYDWYQGNFLLSFPIPEHIPHGHEVEDADVTLGYVTPLSLPPYFDPRTQPNCRNADGTVGNAQLECDLDGSKNYPVNTPVSLTC